MNRRKNFKNKKMAILLQIKKKDAIFATKEIGKKTYKNCLNDLF